MPHTALSSLLDRENIPALDDRRRGQKLIGVLHECRRDRTVEMCGSVAIILKGVKDRETAWSELYSIPDRSTRFGLCQRQRVLQKLFQSRFFARLGVEPHE